MVKRYEFIQYQSSMKESPEGEWVKWEDVQLLLKNIDKELDGLDESLGDASSYLAYIRDSYTNV